LSRAKELVVALNATKGQPEIKGRFFFLSAKDYSLLAALAGVRMSSDYILPSETIEELKDAENLSHGLSARLAPISNPKASDKFQLQYIIGNSREWTEGDGAFGIACDATTAKDTPTLRQLTRQVRPSERIGLRLAFDGAP
jgi:hypothetical protein